MCSLLFKYSLIHCWCFGYSLFLAFILLQELDTVSSFWFSCVGLALSFGISSKALNAQFKAKKRKKCLKIWFQEEKSWFSTQECQLSFSFPWIPLSLNFWLCLLQTQAAGTALMYQSPYSEPQWPSRVLLMLWPGLRDSEFALLALNVTWQSGGPEKYVLFFAISHEPALKWY